MLVSARVRAAAALLVLSWATIAQATTLYVAQGGTDAGNDCRTEANPCATIRRGIAAMAGGDTLVIGDGTYAEQITEVPDGSPAAYTTVKAAHDWGVTIDGSGFANDYRQGIDLYGARYVAIRGFHVVMAQSADRNVGVAVSSSDHVKIQRCSVAYAGTSGNVAAFGVGPGSDYVLVEESYVYGGSRYPFLVYQSTHTVMRRNVSRLDYWGGSLQAANFTNYNSDLTVWQNNIAIDSDDADIGGSGLYAGFFSENKPPDSSWSGTATRQTLRGNIVLNVQATYAGIYDFQVSNLHTLSDNVIWDSHGGYYADYVHGDAPVVDATRFTLGRIRGTYSSPNGQGSGGTGFYVGPGFRGTRVTSSVTDSILWHNPFYGLADYATGHHNSLWNNGAGNYGGSYATPSAGPGDRTTDLTAGLKYLPRIEAGSALATAGQQGGQMGASVEYMWGKTGTLWGEEGYDSITAEPLWPFPNEAVIKADMASYDGPGGAGARGFATGTSLDGSPQTLTRYIWEYLGNPIPDEVYGLHIAIGSLPSGTVGTPYQAALAASGGTLPYRWSVDGDLPPGLSLDDAAGVIAGTPGAAGTSRFTLVVTDEGLPAQTAMASLQIEIVAPDVIGGGAELEGVGCAMAGPRAASGRSLAALSMLVMALAIAIRPGSSRPTPR